MNPSPFDPSRGVHNGGQLHRKLSAFGVLLLTLSANSPVFAIYGMGVDLLQHVGTGAAGLLLLGCGAAVIWAIVYAELASAYPYAGGDYVGVGTILGPWAGIASMTIWTVSSAPLVAYLAKTIAPYLSDLLPGVAPNLATFGALAAALVVALLAVRASTMVTGVLLAIEMLAILALIGAGLWHPARSLGSVLIHPVALAASGTLAAPAIGAMALGGVSAAFATCGGNQAIPFGEELIDPNRHMGRVVLIAGLIGAFGTALPIISVILGSGDLTAILNNPSPCSAFFTSIAGPVAGRALSAGVVIAVFNAMIALIMFSARMLFSLGRDEVFTGYINRLLARVHIASGAPRPATIVIGIVAAACCLLDAHVLLVFLSGVVVYSLALVCCAVLVGRKRGLTGQAGYWRSPLFPLAPVLGLCLSFAFSLADLYDGDVGRPSLLLLGSMVVFAILWHQIVLKRRVGGWSPKLGERHEKAESPL